MEACSLAEAAPLCGEAEAFGVALAAAVEVLSRCPFKPGTDTEGQPVGGAVATVEYVWKLE